ncbi:hypothetical protein NV379_02115 [Paenibacillus sp. N1-5-1-14]|uniref:hypothetical protein n=1 Tax=Paenibacillus radicibacter TaxID=2972488 RepID=UPI002158F25C|nr:hypothetical protein [Paenibacillus radicibacter]MCR8641441.1 hypothetical protein [Paenibacillus radicibacter]
MPKFINLIGVKFNRLVVIERSVNKNGKTAWLCECTCSLKTRKVVQGGHLKNGSIKSCGCLAREVKTKHGMHNTRIYSILRDMKDRCNNINNKSYDKYGGRGINVCDEWLDKENGFIDFYKWALENGYSNKLTIDRIDVNSNYEPSNCRWVTMEVQQNNKRNNVSIEINGHTKTLSEWSKFSGIPRVTLDNRYKQGWDNEDILIPQKRNTAIRQSGVKGIIWDKRRSKWSVIIIEKGKKRQIGSADTVEDGVKIKEIYLMKESGKN